MMRTAVIGLVAVLVVAASLLLLALRETNRMAVAEISFASRSVENGAAIYLDACAGCHGVAGQGVAGVAPALNSVDFFTRRLAEIGYGGSLISYVESTVAAGRPVTAGQYSTTMPAWARQYGGYLRPDQVHDVATFVLNWVLTRRWQWQRQRRCQVWPRVRRRWTLVVRSTQRPAAAAVTDRTATRPSPVPIWPASPSPALTGCPI